MKVCCTSLCTLETDTLGLTAYPEILHSRDRAWTHVSGLEHTVLRVYSLDQDCSDMVVMGSGTVRKPNGRDIVDARFATRFVLDETRSRFCLMEGYGVRTESSGAVDRYH